MKVCIVVSSLKMGGMQRVAANLADSFHAAGHQTTLLTLKDRKQEIYPREKDVDLVKVNLKSLTLKHISGLLYFFIAHLLNIFVRKSFPIWFAKAQVRQFTKVLEDLESQKGKFDLIIFRGQGTFEQIWPINDKRFIYVCENIQQPKLYGYFSSYIFKKIFKDKNVVCVSNGALESFTHMANTYQIVTNKLITINNPNDIQSIYQESKSKEQLHPKPYILGLGRIEPQKNFQLLLEAYKYAVDHHHIKEDLLIVGDGSDLKNVQTLAKRLGIEHKVYFKGKQTNPYPWFSQAKLFVLSSKFEGLGMVLVESLVCGTKVVSTDCLGGVRQIMRGPLEKYLSREEPKQLGDKILQALHDDLEEDEINHIINQFDGDSIVAEFINKFKFDTPNKI